MAKETWEEEVYETGEENMKRSQKTAGEKANLLLTIVTVVFFIVVIALISVLVYLSTGGSNKKTATEGFYSTSVNAGATTETTPAASSEENAEEAEDKTEETKDSSQSTEGTITVLAGEGEAAIAARAGISIADLERLNPSHMSRGYWYADPGDLIKVQ